MKKLTSLLLAALLLLSALAGCAPAPAREDNGTLHIVTTIFPIYDWVRSVVGGDGTVEVTLLLQNGTDMHSYQPSVDDIVTISTCDVFFYVGGESDAWVEDALAQAVNPDLLAFSMLDLLGDLALEEETVEGMEADGDEGEEVPDEHVWLSLRNAAYLTDGIAAALMEADPARAGAYRRNADIYIPRLRALDADYEATVAAGTKDTLLFADRFPFRYLTEDYGLTYYAAFAGCSAETEASFETVAFLAGKVDELDLDVILTIDGGDGALAGTVRAQTAGKDQTILTLDSLQSVTAADIEAGLTYCGVMADNLAVLEAALA